MLKKIFFGSMVFTLLVAAMVMCFSPPVNAASKMNSVNQKVMSNDDTAALGISAQGLRTSAKLFSTTGVAVIQRVHSVTNWTRFDVFTSTRGRLVNNGYMSNGAAKFFQTRTAQLNGNNGTVDNLAYVMAWITSNSLMVNMADYNNSATNSWNNNSVSFNDGQCNLNEAIAFNQITSNTTGEVNNISAWNNSNYNVGVINYLNQSVEGTNTAAFKNNDVNYLNGTLNSGANNSLNGLAKAKTTQHLMSYLV